MSSSESPVTEVKTDGIHHFLGFCQAGIGHLTEDFDRLDFIPTIQGMNYFFHVGEIARFRRVYDLYSAWHDHRTLAIRTFHYALAGGWFQRCPASRAVE